MHLLFFGKHKFHKVPLEIKDPTTVLGRALRHALNFRVAASGFDAVLNMFPQISELTFKPFQRFG